MIYIMYCYLWFRFLWYLEIFYNCILLHVYLFYRNYKLLSFGDEAEEQEEEVDLASKDSKGKGKSSHDLIDDPTLSTEITEIDSEEVRQRLAQPPKVCC